MPSSSNPPSDLSSLVDKALQALSEAGEIEPRRLDASAPTRLLTFLELLQKWNQAVDLTAARSPAELVDLVVADAAVLASRIPEGHAVVDVGTGAGTPGLPLALFRPDLIVNLVEPKQKRIAFMRSAVGTLGLPVADAGNSGVRPGQGGVVVTRCSTEALPAAVADTAVSRAMFSPERWLEEGARLARSRVWVLLARGEAPELSGWAGAPATSYCWPLTGVPRRAIEYHKNSV